MALTYRRVIMATVVAWAFSTLAFADEPFNPELQNWIRRPTQQGVTIEVLRGPRAGHALNHLPVKAITNRRLREAAIEQLPPGLYLVDLDYIPGSVKQALADFKLTLKPDGTLVDTENNPARAFIGGEAGRLRTRSDLDASPYPFNCYTFNPWAVYYSGFHRWYDARTYAGTYTLDPSGHCSVLSPRTNIQYLQTYAVVGGGPDIDVCYNCNGLSSQDIWDVGYFWPAHGTPTTYHHAVFRDDPSGIYFARTAMLSW